MQKKVNILFRMSIFSIFIVVTLSGCSDLQEQFDHLKKEKSNLEVYVAKLKNELKAMKDKSAGEENVSLIKLEIALEHEKEKNSRTKKELMQEYNSEFSEVLRNQIENKIWWSTFWYVLLFVLVIILVSSISISNAKRNANRDIDVEKNKYKEKLNEYSARNDDYIKRLEYMSSKSNEMSEEVRAKSELGKILDKVKFDLHKITLTESEK